MTARKLFTLKLHEKDFGRQSLTLILIVMLKLMTACTSLYSRTSIHGALSIGSITDSVQLVEKVDECLMECIYTEDFEGDERPAPAEYIELGIDQEWTELIPVIGNLARVFHQDSFNLPKVQKGLETFRADGLTLTKYQRSKSATGTQWPERFIAN